MPQNITDVGAFTSPVTRPAGSDARTADLWSEGHQALSNRSRYLLNASQGVASGGERFLTLSGSRGQPETETADVLYFNDSLDIMTPSIAAIFALTEIPHGASLTAIHAMVDAFATNGTDGNRMGFIMTQTVLNWSSAARTTSFLNGGTVIRCANSAAIQIVDFTPSDFPLVHDKEKPLHARITASVDAAAGNADSIHAVRVRWTDPAA